MTEPMTGSIEIRTHTGESHGLPGQRWTRSAVPVVLETLHGITGMEAVEPEAQPTGRVPEAQWRGVDECNQGVTIFLWRDIPFDETVIAQAIADAIAEGQGA